MCQGSWRVPAANRAAKLQCWRAGFSPAPGLLSTPSLATSIQPPSACTAPTLPFLPPHQTKADLSSLMISLKVGRSKGLCAQQRRSSAT